MSTFVNPAVRDCPKIPWSTGRLRSVSTSSVLAPIWENAIARLATEVDFPSPGPGLVTNTVLIGRSTFVYWMFVRSVLYASEMGDLGAKCVMSRDSISEISPFGSCLFLFVRSGVMNGIEPSTVKPSLSTSSIDLRDVSMYSLRKVSPIPKPSPTMIPNNRFIFFFGLIGYLGGMARSTIRTNPI